MGSARKGGRFCSKSSEIGRTIETLWRAIPRILLHFLSTYQTCIKRTRKSTEFCQFFCRQNPPDPSRFCSKSSEIGRTIQTLWRAIPRILLHFFIHIPNMHKTYQKKCRILPVFLSAESAGPSLIQNLQKWQ